MKIVFYSSNSNVFDKENFIIKVKPSNETQFDSFCKKHPEHDFICISQAPAMYMPEKSLILLRQELTASEFAKEILKYKPDLAIAMSFWVNPYDWLTVNDALIAEELRKNDVRTISHSVETGLVCFDKWRTHQKLLQLGFNIPKGLFVDHDMYFCAGSHKEVLNNVYKASVYNQIKELNLPLIIKDTAGLSSYGMTVVHTYGEAVGYLNSKRNNSNRLVEEYIHGEQFGVEIYGVPGNYTVLPPFRFSLNQYGITSPKQSAKSGPEKLEQQLEEMLLKLAEELSFEGCTQVDLIKSQEKWYIIEINPRLSGMSFTYSTTLGISVFELLYKTCIEKTNLQMNKNKVLNLKLPLMSEEQMNEVLNIDGVKLLNQTNDLAAKQEREKGFCECIIATEIPEKIKSALTCIKALFPDEATIQQSETILK